MSLRHFVHHKSHMDWPDTLPRTLYEIISIPLCIVPRSFGVKRSMAILILVSNQLDAQFLMYVCLLSTCFGQPFAHQQENYCINATSGLSLCVDKRLVCRSTVVKVLC